MEHLLDRLAQEQDTVVSNLRLVMYYRHNTILSMIYNMGTGILRAVGDSRRPMYFLITAAFVNIVLDLLFVAVFHWGVLGAALATIISQLVSALLTLASLIGAELRPYHLKLHRVAMDAATLADIVRIGLPAGLQSVMYNISNIIIQTSINAFGTTTVAAWTAYGKLDSLFWMSMNSMGLSVTTFAGQNFGAKQYDRVRKGAWVCLFFCAVLALGLGAVIYVFGSPLVGLFSDDAQVVERALEIIRLLTPCFITYASIEALSGTIRGSGDAWVPMVLTAGGVCGLRILWVVLAAPLFGTLTGVLLSYPISWGVTSVLYILYFLAGGWLRRCIAVQEARQAGGV